METIYRYTDLRPNELKDRLERLPVAIAPWGALEWHGPHLPFGLGGLVAEAFSEQLAARAGAVLLPTTYLPLTTLPHVQSIPFRAEVVRGSWEDLFIGLGAAGFQLVCLVSGHYAHGHEIVLAEVADWIERLQSTDDPQPLYDLYARRRSSYQGYVDRYYEGSWDRALQAWWADHSG